MQEITHANIFEKRHAFSAVLEPMLDLISLNANSKVVTTCEFVNIRRRT